MVPYPAIYLNLYALTCCSMCFIAALITGILLPQGAIRIMFQLHRASITIPLFGQEFSFDARTVSQFQLIVAGARLAAL